MSQHDPLRLYFSPTLTSRQRMICRIFWNKCLREPDTDVFRQMRHLSDNLGVGPIDDLMHILKFCYVYDTRYQCQVCQRLRFIDSPTDLGITPKLPYHCDDCSMLIE